MARVRKEGTAPELVLRKALQARGLRPGSAKIVGSPDLVFYRRRLAVFVDGCFWHGCPKHGSVPKRNASFWIEKILRNQHRDLTVNRELRGKQWTVVRVWEHEVRGRLHQVVTRIQLALDQKA